MRTRSKVVLGVGLALGLGLERAALADDAAPESAPPAGVEEVRSKQRYRLDLGMGMQGVGVATTGALGGLSSPFARAGFEARLAGPAWLMLEAHGSVGTNEGYGSASSWWSAGGAIGVRLEQPVYDFVSVGGYGVVLGSYSRAGYAGPGPDGAPIGADSSAFSVGAAFGVDLHFRASSFFGVRLGLELLRAGYEESWDDWTGDGASGAFGRLTASPRVALTFTF